MAELAINGGEPAVKEGLKTHWPIFDDTEKEALIEILESGHWCSMGGGGRVEQFEEKFAEFIGTKYAMCVPTGTDALELAFRAIGLEPGDEVIVPAVTFIASASALVLANGVPIFVDVDPETYQISPEAIEAAITPRTRAIEPVHYGGYPADMDRIMDIADKHDLFVIEDCAEAHGSEWKGKKVGSFGDMGCFSFQMGKPLTCGEGGGVTYDDDDLAISCYSYARLGRKPGGEKYKHYIPAGNFRMSEFLGGILSTQLSRLPQQTQIRYENGEYFATELEKIEGISALKRDPRVTKRGYYFYFLRYDSSKWNNVHRNKFMEALQAEGVGCGTAHNDPLYQNPAFKNIKKSLLHGNEVDYSKVHCPEAERIYNEEVIAMGKNFLMERENIDKILAAIYKLRENLDELSKLKE
ncbi:MAG: DegT/DnrJ/EryC1/StrS family aminotransferase [bacterium]